MDVNRVTKLKYDKKCRKLHRKYLVYKTHQEISFPLKRYPNPSAQNSGNLQNFESMISCLYCNSHVLQIGRGSHQLYVGCDFHQLCVDCGLKEKYWNCNCLQNLHEFLMLCYGYSIRNAGPHSRIKYPPEKVSGIIILE